MKVLIANAFAAASLVAAPISAAVAQDITGAGASFPAPVYAKWADAYNKATGVRDQLPVGRFWRRIASDSRQDR